MQIKINNYYNSDFEAEALKLHCYMPQAFLDGAINPSTVFFLANTNSQ